MKQSSAAPLDARLSGIQSGGPSFALRHRLFRALWSLAWLLLARWTPPMAHGWRITLLRLFGAKIDASAKVYASAVIWYPPNLTMEAGAVMGPGVHCYCMDRITLGKGAIVSQRSFLCAGTHDIDDVHFQLVTMPIVIGERAWVAAEAFVGSGVVVGEGAVLAARGVAVGTLEPWTVYGGNPASVIRGRRH